MTKWLQYEQNFILLPLVVAACFVVTPTMRNIELALSVSTLVVFPLGVFSFFASNYFGLTSPIILRVYQLTASHSRAMFLYSNPNVAGYYFLVVFVFLAGTVGDIGNIFKLSRRSVVLWFSIFGVVLTVSKSAILVLFILLTIKIALDGRTKSRRALGLFTAFSVVLVSVVIFKYLESSLWVFQSKYILNNIRWEKWLVGLHQLRMYWAIGQPPVPEVTAATNIYATTSTFSDNEFIQIVLQFGIVGISFLLYSIGWLIRTYVGAQRIRFVQYRMMRDYLLLLVVGCMFNDFINFYPDNIIVAIIFFRLWFDYREITRKQSFSEKITPTLGHQPVVWER
ncbi:O-antigen ligase family protein [Alicyclobacillus curvatus]|nr:O-antigen ligase family protein [Alicyclobacillus curvatus]